MHNSAAELIPPFDDSIPIQSLPLMAWVIVVGPGNFAKYVSPLWQKASFT